nr:PASTA domain-containing protein [Quadrisphaera sp. RL12-1S]
MTGKSLDEAKGLLSAQDLQLNVIQFFGTRVVKQDPAPGTLLAPGSTVTLYTAP